MKVASPPQLSQNTSAMECKKCQDSSKFPWVKNHKSSEVRFSAIPCPLRRHRETETQHWQTRTTPENCQRPNLQHRRPPTNPSFVWQHFFGHWGSQEWKKSSKQKMAFQMLTCHQGKKRKDTAEQAPINTDLAPPQG